MTGPYGSSPSRSDQPAFTLIEVVAVAAIIALQISILLPSLARTRGISRRVVCAGGLHNIALGVA